MTTATLPRIALRGQKLAALMALAHTNDIPVPESLRLTGDAITEDISWDTDLDDLTVWHVWLGGELQTVRGPSGCDYTILLADTILRDWGPVRVRITAVKEPS